MPDETVEDKVEEGKASALLRALKLMAKVDWKSIMLVMIMLGGAGGYTMDWLDDRHASRTHGASYDILATRMEELAERIDDCESEYLDPVEEPERVWETGGRSHAIFSPEDARALEVEEARIRSDGAVAYKRARLPAFDQIAQYAEQEINLIQFMNDLKAKK